jgi:hypothetical protein
MADTKARSKKAKPKARAQQAKAKPRSASKPKARSTAKPRKRPAGKSGSSNGGKSKAASKVAVGKPQAIAGNVGDAAKDAGGAVGRAVSKAKVPLMAGGAALAGAAGGVALGVRQAHRHRGIAGIDSGDLAKAARKVGDVGVQVGELAFEARRAREASNGRHRSPIEVVLQGLTSRGSRR